jgi:hypothetical protein
VRTTAGKEPYITCWHRNPPVSLGLRFGPQSNCPARNLSGRNVAFVHLCCKNTNPRELEGLASRSFRRHPQCTCSWLSSSYLDAVAYAFDLRREIKSHSPPGHGNFAFGKSGLSRRPHECDPGPHRRWPASPLRHSGFSDRAGKERSPRERTALPSLCHRPRNRLGAVRHRTGDWDWGSSTPFSAVLRSGSGRSRARASHAASDELYDATRKYYKRCDSTAERQTKIKVLLSHLEIDTHGGQPAGNTIRSKFIQVGILGPPGRSR